MESKVRNRRLELKMTQSELSRKTGISRTTLNKIESGRQTNVTTSTIVKIANALQADPASLFLQ